MVDIGRQRADARGNDARLWQPMDVTILHVTRDRPVLLGHSIRSVLANGEAAEPEVVRRVLVVDDSDDGSAEAVAAALDVD